MASLLSEEQFKCSICLECFRNPVSIPCGHNFCLKCIKHYWDVAHKSECPLCKETFRHRPELRINVGLKEITEKFQRSVKETQRPVPAKRHNIKRQSSKPEPVPCDMCQENKLTAVKSCHICQASFCENHLAPHLSNPVMMKHRLTDPATFSKSHLCRHHNKVLEKFCKKDHVPVCMTCIEKDHKHHELVPMEKEINKIKIKMKKTQEQYQQMIQTRLKKAEEINESVELSKRNKEKDIQTSVQAAAKMISDIEENQALVLREIEWKYQEVERKAEELLKEINQEINELENRHSELHHLEHIENPFLLLQSSHVTPPMYIKHWPDVKVQSENYIGTVRKTFSKLAEICHDLEKEMSAEEVSRVSKYAVDVTLDPVTAAGWLILSPDGKKVSLSSLNWKNLLPDNPRRFDSCVAVLGKQSFTSGKHYWVVQVGNKRDWDLGVARESINRKGAITVRPDNGYWAICRRKGGSLCACAGPSVTLHLNEIPQKVGIFLDYEEGLVSFYNTEAKTHVYTYSGLTFTEPLYPYFNPCLHDNGMNTAPLVICLVEDALTVDPVVV